MAFATYRKTCNRKENSVTSRSSQTLIKLPWTKCCLNITTSSNTTLKCWQSQHYQLYKDSIYWRVLVFDCIITQGGCVYSSALCKHPDCSCGSSQISECCLISTLKSKAHWAVHCCLLWISKASNMKFFDQTWAPLVIVTRVEWETAAAPGVTVESHCRHRCCLTDSRGSTYSRCEAPRIFIYKLWKTSDLPCAAIPPSCVGCRTVLLLYCADIYSTDLVPDHAFGCTFVAWASTHQLSLASFLKRVFQTRSFSSFSPLLCSCFVSVHAHNVLRHHLQLQHPTSPLPAYSLLSLFFF